MITPQEATVDRAWQRGLELGRYKAVDDLLAHNVEAYTGMQNILFGRVLDPKASVHCEFLDSNVPRGEVPLTAAFGWSGIERSTSPRAAQRKSIRIGRQWPRKAT